MVQIVRLGPGGAGPAITKQPPPAPRAGAGITAVAVPGRGQQASGAGAAGRGPPSPTSSIPPPPSRPPPQTEIGILADDCTAVAERWSDHNGALKFFRDRVLKGEIWRKLLTTDERVLRAVHDKNRTIRSARRARGIGGRLWLPLAKNSATHCSKDIASSRWRLSGG